MGRGENTIGMGFEIPLIRGSIFHGLGVKISVLGGSIYHGWEDRYTMGMEFNKPRVGV